MSDETLVRFGSPTLAGLKTGSLFTCEYNDLQELSGQLRDMNRKLVPKGLRLLPLRRSEKRVLLYLYRPDRLEKDLSKLADILGHSSIETTRIYIISTGSEHRARLEQMRLIV